MPLLFCKYGCKMNNACHETNKTKSILGGHAIRDILTLCVNRWLRLDLGQLVGPQFSVAKVKKRLAVCANFEREREREREREKMQEGNWSLKDILLFFFPYKSSL